MITKFVSLIFVNYQTPIWIYKKLLQIKGTQAQLWKHLKVTLSLSFLSGSVPLTKDSYYLQRNLSKCGTYKVRPRKNSFSLITLVISTKSLTFIGAKILPGPSSLSQMIWILHMLAARYKCSVHSIFSSAMLHLQQPRPKSKSLMTQILQL